MLEVKSLSQKYGSFLAVDDVSFKVEKGEIVGLLGPNGAGKSTTMKVIATFLSPTQGNVIVNDHSVIDSSLQVKQTIGYLPENCPLYDDMLVMNYLMFCSEIRNIPAKKRKMAIQKVISNCGLSSVIYKPIAHLSKGFRQRVGLAQALLHDPAVLILDEPTSGLDPNQIRDILKLIAELGKEKTVIHSTHILSEVETTSSRILIINNGKLVAQGSPQDLMQQQGESITYIAVNSPNFDQIVTALGSVQNITKLDTQGLFTRYSLQLPTVQDAEEKLFKLAVEKGLVLKELHSKTTSLDHVFSKLTKGK